MTSIHPFLWFDRDAEAAANFYCGIFKNSKVTQVTRAPADNPSTKAGEALTVAFKIDGNPFVALNGGKQAGFKFNESISFVVNCETQKEVDDYWDKLTAGGEPGQCGWLKDKYGVSWQVIPPGFSDVMFDAKNPEGSKRAMQAMMSMKKLDIDALKRAAKG